MRRTRISVATFVFACLLSSFTSCNAGRPALADDLSLFRLQALPPGLRTISTSGSSEVIAPPDKVTVVFAVKTFDKTLETARAANDSARKKVVALGQKFQIAREDVQVTDISVDPIYVEAGGTSRTYSYTTQAVSKPTGYSMSQSIGFVLRKPAVLNELVQDALSAGANTVSTLKYETTRLRTYRDQARLAALKAAREKANALANELGMKLGKAIQVTEEGGSAGMVSNRFYDNNVMQSSNSYSGGSGSSESSAADEGGDGPSLGQLSIRAAVRTVLKSNEMTSVHRQHG